ncbi:MAG: ABC transporter permease subunit [Treponema sp.]|jgi:putative aldouronate transport system permease protein|nr:ABC transporter permease subunit [Treponema sp.]
MIQGVQKKYGRYWQLYLFLILPAAYSVIFAYIPMFGVQIAFKKYSILGGIWGSPWAGLANFRKFFNSYMFTRVIGNTLRISFYDILAGFPFPIIFALCLNTIENRRYKKVLQTITYMPHFISVVVVVGILMQIFHPLNGIYGVLVKSLSGATAPDLFGKPGAFPHLYVWSGIWQSFGWSSIIYVASLTSVAEELYEAARVDGASRFKMVLHVDLPALAPTITILLILRLGAIMSLGFEKAWLMQNSLNLRTSELISTYVYKQGLAAGGPTDFSYAAAIGLFNSAINLLLIVLVNKTANKLSETSLW